MTRNSVPPTTEEMCDRIASEWADRGKVVEGGWQAYAAISGLPEQTLAQMRSVFFLGAQHLFGCIMGIMDHDHDEPTERDLRRIELIHQELDDFSESLGKGK